MTLSATSGIISIPGSFSGLAEGREEGGGGTLWVPFPVYFSTKAELA